MKRIQPHIHCGLGDVGKYVLLSGDPGRIERIAARLEDAERVAAYRGFIVWTGRWQGVVVSAASTGIGSPSAAIVVEELANVGAEVLIRVGTCGALRPEIELGDLVIAKAAVRFEGTTRSYLPVEYPAVADPQVFAALGRAARESRVRFWEGTVVTCDAFYRSVEPLGAALAVEMESAAIFIVAETRGLKAASILAVDSNLPRGISKGEFEPGERKGELFPAVQKAIEKEIEIALRAVGILEGKV